MALIKCNKCGREWQREIPGVDWVKQECRACKEARGEKVSEHETEDGCLELPAGIQPSGPYGNGFMRILNGRGWIEPPSVPAIAFCAAAVAALAASVAKAGLAYRLEDYPAQAAPVSLWIESPNGRLESQPIDPANGPLVEWGPEDPGFAAIAADWQNGESDLSRLGFGESAISVREYEWSLVPLSTFDWTGYEIAGINARVSILGGPIPRQRVVWQVATPEPAAAMLMLVAAAGWLTQARARNR